MVLIVGSRIDHKEKFYNFIIKQVLSRETIFNIR